MVLFLITGLAMAQCGDSKTYQFKTNNNTQVSKSYNDFAGKPYGGVGIFVNSKNGAIIIEQVIKDGPLYNLGTVTAGDKILSVTNEFGITTNFKDKTVDEARKAIIGEKGKTISFNIEKANGKQEMISVQRCLIIPKYEDKEVTFVGFGFELGYDELGAKVNAITPNSPVSNSEFIKVGMVMTSIDGIILKGKKIHEITEMLKTGESTKILEFLLGPGNNQPVILTKAPITTVYQNWILKYTFDCAIETPKTETKQENQANKQNSENPNKIELQKISDMKIYPNPNKGQFSFSAQFGQKADLSLEIKDLTGKSIQKWSFSGVDGVFNESLEIKSVSAGVYLLNIIHGDSQLTEKIVIE